MVRSLPGGRLNERKAESDDAIQSPHNRRSMTFVGPFVSRLSVVAAYVAFAFVGAIVLGVF